jgi:hypothetical protein
VKVKYKEKRNRPGNQDRVPGFGSAARQPNRACASANQRPGPLVLAVPSRQPRRAKNPPRLSSNPFLIEISFSLSPQKILIRVVAVSAVPLLPWISTGVLDASVKYCLSCLRVSVWISLLTGICAQPSAARWSSRLLFSSLQNRRPEQQRHQRRRLLHARLRPSNNHNNNYEDPLYFFCTTTCIFFVILLFR